MADDDTIFDNLPGRPDDDDVDRARERRMRKFWRAIFEPEGPLQPRPIPVRRARHHGRVDFGSGGRAIMVTVAPVASGTGTVGQVLSCTTGTWTGSPTAYAYQWTRDGVPIAGATASSYTLVAADSGHSIRCTVTATGPGGTGTAYSNAIACA